MKLLKLSLDLILVGLLLVIRNLKTNTENKPVNQKEPSHKQESITHAKHPDARSPHTTPQKPTTNDEQWKADQREHWRRQLRPQWGLFWISACGIFAALFTLRALYDTLEATRDQAASAKASADIARDTLVASRRPWVDIEMTVDGEGSLLTKDGEIRAPIKYKTTNHGTSPAVGVWLHPELTLYTPGFDLDREQSEICKMGQKDTPTYAMGGHVLFPGRSFEIIVTHVISKSGVQKSLQAWESTTGHSVDILAPVIIGCVTYRYTFDNTIHKTPIMAKLVKKNPNVRGAVPTLASDSKLNLRANAGPIPLNSIFVTPEITMSGIRAD